MGSDGGSDGGSDRGSDATVFPATPAQAGVVGRLLREFNDEFAVSGPTAAEFAQRLRILLDRDDVLALLAGTAADPSGLALLTLRPTPYWDGPLAQLEELYVVPARRGSGVGTALLRRAVAEVGDRGAQEMHINVDEVDVDARRFYERHGFVNVEPGQEQRMLCYLREF